MEDFVTPKYVYQRKLHQSTCNWLKYLQQAAPFSFRLKTQDNWATIFIFLGELLHFIEQDIIGLDLIPHNKWGTCATESFDIIAFIMLRCGKLKYWVAMYSFFFYQIPVSSTAWPYSPNWSFIRILPLFITSILKKVCSWPCMQMLHLKCLLSSYISE